MNTNNHFNVIFELLNSIFRQFFTEDSVKEFNSKSFYSFDGVSEKRVLDIYENSSVKESLPFDLSPQEVLVILAVTAPYYHPDAYRGARYIRKIDEESFAIIGGKIIGDNKCFYPTGETVMFLLGGHYVPKRILFEDLISPDSKLFNTNLIDISPAEQGAPRMSGQLYPTQELLMRINGKKFYPEYGTNFPASRIETRMEWEDLVLPYETYEELMELKVWMKHGCKLDEHPELSKRIKPGYKTLFYGPPGTGKTLTASLIGKTFGVDVYRIDLSMLVSKWIGETEKNLKGIFDQASNKNWILFFDEADSLFGKRTQTNSSNDRYANQEVSYLLQRIEDFPGLVILASNLKSNIDEAFNRRFQSTILFPMPNSETRYTLWSKAFPSDFHLHKEIDLPQIADKYELAGGSIINIVRFCVLMAMERETNEIIHEDIEHSRI